MYLKYFFACGISVLLISCSSTVRYSSSKANTMKTTNAKQTQLNNFVQTGIASYYADKFDGRTTASGDVFSQDKLTAAHRTLPFGSILKVTHLNNGKSVIVVVNDRGPYAGNRIIDLSKAAAERLGMLAEGIAKVRIEIINK